MTISLAFDRADYFLRSCKSALYVAAPSTRFSRCAPLFLLCALFLLSSAHRVKADTIFLVIAQDRISFVDDTTPLDGGYTITNKTTNTSFTGSATAGVGVTDVNPTSWTAGSNSFEMTLDGQTWDFSVKIDENSLPTRDKPIKLTVISRQELPEPGTLVLFGSGLGSLAIALRRRFTHA